LLFLNAMFPFLTIWSVLVRWDQHLFEKINNDWTNPFFDALMPFMRNSIHWAPLYLFVLALVLVNFRTKGVWWVVFFLSTVALCDITGTQLFKHIIQRVRPCNDPFFASHVRLVVQRCAAGFSFISNHAANHFGMACFFIISFRRMLGRWVWLAMLWAPLIAYAQVYVGVHYPLDVLAGAIVGAIYGSAMGFIFNNRFGFSNFGDQPTA
jgi:membrane-associated phospholipid phosphatase